MHIVFSLVKKYILATNIKYFNHKNYLDNMMWTQFTDSRKHVIIY